MAKPKRSGGAGKGYTVSGVDTMRDDPDYRVEVAQGLYAYRLERAGLQERHYLVDPRLLWRMHCRIERTLGAGRERMPNVEALEQVMAAQIEAARWAETEDQLTAELTVQAALIGGLVREEPFEGGARVNERTAAAVAQTLSLAVQGTELEPEVAIREVRGLRNGSRGEPDLVALLDDAHTAGRAHGDKAPAMTP